MEARSHITAPVYLTKTLSVCTNYFKNIFCCRSPRPKHGKREPLKRARFSFHRRHVRATWEYYGRIVVFLNGRICEGLAPCGGNVLSSDVYVRHVVNTLTNWNTKQRINRQKIYALPLSRAVALHRTEYPQASFGPCYRMKPRTLIKKNALSAVLVAQASLV